MLNYPVRDEVEHLEINKKLFTGAQKRKMKRAEAVAQGLTIKPRNRKPQRVNINVEIRSIQIGESWEKTNPG